LFLSEERESVVEYCREGFTCTYEIDRRPECPGKAFRVEGFA